MAKKQNAKKAKKGKQNRIKLSPAVVEARAGLIPSEETDSLGHDYTCAGLQGGQCDCGSDDWDGSLSSTESLNASEWATILAALRFWQSKLGPDNLPAQANVERDLYFWEVKPLSKKQIDALCVRLNS